MLIERDSNAYKDPNEHIFKALNVTGFIIAMIFNGMA